MSAVFWLAGILMTDNQRKTLYVMLFKKNEFTYLITCRIWIYRDELHVLNTWWCIRTKAIKCHFDIIKPSVMWFDSAVRCVPRLHDFILRLLQNSGWRSMIIWEVAKLQIFKKIKFATGHRLAVCSLEVNWRYEGSLDYRYSFFRLIHKIPKSLAFYKTQICVVIFTRAEQLV